MKCMKISEFQGKNAVYVDLIDLENGGQFQLIDDGGVLSQVPNLVPVDLAVELMPRRYGRNVSFKVQSVIQTKKEV